MLEEGAATLSKEESGRLAAHQMKFIRNLEMALVRIENKTYGICKTTGKLIPKERLMKVPHALLSANTLSTIWPRKAAGNPGGGRRERRGPGKARRRVPVRFRNTLPNASVRPTQ